MTRFGWITRGVVLGGAAWLAGLVWFTGQLGAPSPDPATKVDAIVVLTGGSMRLEAGVDLLKAGKGRKLFISGVHGGVDAAALLGPAGAGASWMTCCVVLGHEAANTLGNAIETAHWLAQQHYRSIRLVTANYHMRRSLLEFRRVLPPDIAIIPDPVFPRDGKLGMRLIVTEYDKLLLALARTLVLPGHAFSHADPLGFR